MARISLSPTLFFHNSSPPSLPPLPSPPLPSPVVHSVLLLFQAVTLNVAINSHNKALLTIMVSNNFVEIKGSVFKKFETKNLFQMSCSGRVCVVSV